VWEDSRNAYLDQLLIRRRGAAPALAVLLFDVLRSLFLARAIDFAVRIECAAPDALPAASPLAGFSRSMLELEGGGVLNTCTTDALVEMLRGLKRAFWPFAWDTGRDAGLGGSGDRGGGGFQCALAGAGCR